VRFDVITIFPEFFVGPLDYGIVRRAREAGLVEVALHDLRDATHDRHRTVDDRPFGGGAGMVLKPEPLFETVETLCGVAGTAAGPKTAIVLLSAAGKTFRQETARRYAGLKRLILICGRYEGVDERVAEYLADEEISVGDFVLSGGELPAALVIDAVTRLLPGALGNEESAVNESFSEVAAEPAAKKDAPILSSDAARGESRAVEQGPMDRSPAAPAVSRDAARGILDYPHYTRPQVFRGWEVPEILLSGNHQQILRWRRKMALAKTLRNRPDLLPGASLTEE
jgi:tRNA (guanine37-N1)-methyltransferase